MAESTEDRGGVEPPGAEEGLEPLRAFRTLTVGPAVVEPARVRTPYRLTGLDGREEETELIYRWEEELFSPEEPDSLNLAALITAQAALNYGLFCDEIRFCGPFDSADRRFLNGAAGNTAREIYVNKFLRPNPFLVGPASNLPVIRSKSYLRARLVFEPNRTGAGALRREGRGWAASPERCAVLSSGGKDSLLSFGLVRELGYEVHPLFVNESGRHWFTALNAYRYLRDRVPETGRVWTNADRLYNWMLRFLPFVRPDHLRLRSDAYPVRLWTVAVFLFGILPLV